MIVKIRRNGNVLQTNKLNGKVTNKTIINSMVFNTTCNGQEFELTESTVMLL